MISGWEYGLIPSMVVLNWRLHTSPLNLWGHGYSIWWIHNTPSSFRCDAFHPNNIANYFQQNSLQILGIIGMFPNILWGGPCSLSLLFDSMYLSCPNFGHITLSAYSPLHTLQSLGWSWYDIYLTPNISTFYFPLCNLWERHYHLEVPYLWITYS